MELDVIISWVPPDDPWVPLDVSSVPKLLFISIIIDTTPI